MYCVFEQMNVYVLLIYWMDTAPTRINRDSQTDISALIMSAPIQIVRHSGLMRHNGLYQRSNVEPSYTQLVVTNCAADTGIRYKQPCARRAAAGVI